MVGCARVQPEPQTDTDSRKPCLEAIGGSARGRLFPLDKRAMVIGRMQGVEILIDDPGVSRRHVKLTIDPDGRVEAVDMRSTNGMLINGAKVERVQLDDGDEISLGPDACLRLTRLTANQMAEGVVLLPSTPPLHPRTPKRLDADTTHILDHKPQLEPKPQLDHRPKLELEDLPLSARQLQVSQLVADGLTNAEVAGRLGISPRTVTSHLDHIYGRLNISSRAALTRWIVERGLVSTDD